MSVITTLPNQIVGKRAVDVSNDGNIIAAVNMNQQIGGDYVLFDIYDVTSESASSYATPINQTTLAGINPVISLRNQCHITMARDTKDMVAIFRFSVANLGVIDVFRFNGSIWEKLTTIIPDFDFSTINCSTCVMGIQFNNDGTELLVDIIGPTLYRYDKDLNTWSISYNFPTMVLSDTVLIRYASQMSRNGNHIIFVNGDSANFPTKLFSVSKNTNTGDWEEPPVFILLFNFSKIFSYAINNLGNIILTKIQGSGGNGSYTIEVRKYNESNGLWELYGNGINFLVDTSGGQIDGGGFPIDGYQYELQKFSEIFNNGNSVFVDSIVWVYDNNINDWVQISELIQPFLSQSNSQYGLINAPDIKIINTYDGNKIIKFSANGNVDNLFDFSTYELNLSAYDYILENSLYPDNSIGTSGDYYFDLSSLNLFGPKVNNLWDGTETQLGTTNTFTVDSSIPLDSLGDNGDYYVNTENFTLYGPKANGSWTGTETQLGNGVLGTISYPNDLFGEDGDYYIDVENNYIYGPKANGTWLGTETELGNVSVNGILSDNIEPMDGVGIDGDYYIDTSTNILYGPKANGSWPTEGVSLDPPGNTGGQSSSPIISSGLPDDSEDGIDGDYYIDTSTNILYGPKANGSWPTEGVSLDPPGNTGGQSSSPIISSGLPDDSEDGIDGDYYIDTSTNILYGPKANGSWPTEGVSLDPPGNTGSQSSSPIISSGLPDDSEDGIDGDYYIDTSTNTLYGPKANGSWPTEGVSLIEQQEVLTTPEPPNLILIEDLTNNTRLYAIILLLIITIGFFSILYFIKTK